MNSEEDKIKLINLKVDIFNTSLNVMDTLRKYNFKIIDKPWELETITIKNR